MLRRSGRSGGTRADRAEPDPTKTKVNRWREFASEETNSRHQDLRRFIYQLRGLMKMKIMFESNLIFIFNKAR